MVMIIEMTELNSQDSGDTREEHEEECNVSSFACAICLNNVSSNKRFKNGNRCVTHSYCVDCIEKHIKAKLEDHRYIAEIKCPALDCNEVLDPLACGSILSPRLFERWCDVLCESTLMQCPKAYCPFQNCSTLILNEYEASVTKSTCPVCKRLFCFKCGRPWHAGYSCDEARGMTDQNDILFGALMESNEWKRCPICRHCVELESGCCFIKCRCGIQFCYSCGKKVDDDRHNCPCNTVHIELGLIGSVLVLFLLVLILIVIGLIHLLKQTVKYLKNLVAAKTFDS